MERPEITRAIEAIVMVADQPIATKLLAELLEVPAAEVDAACQELAAGYEVDGRGFILAKVAGGWRYQSHPELAEYVERFVLEGQSARLSAAALETLAIVAYKQPLSRAQVAAIRGVNVDGVMRTLEQRGYIDEVGRDPGPGPGGAVRHHHGVPREAGPRQPRPAAAPQRVRAAGRDRGGARGRAAARQRAADPGRAPGRCRRRGRPAPESAGRHRTRRGHDGPAESEPPPRATEPAEATSPRSRRWTTWPASTRPRPGSTPWSTRCGIASRPPRPPWPNARRPTPSRRRGR